MTAARELLNRLAEIGATVRPSGDNRLIVRAGANPVPAELVRRLREAKPEVLEALAGAGHTPDFDPSGSGLGSWNSHFIVRTIDRALGGYRSHREAELLAFGDMILAWHRQHGRPPDSHRCAGCGDELPDDGGLVVDRAGVRVHFDAVRRDNCIIVYGQKWRGEAVAGLRALGLDPPEGFGLL